MNIKIVPISKVLSKKAFDCGITELNQYFRQYAFTNDKKTIGRTFVAVKHNIPFKPIGYYTVSSAQIFFNDLPEDMKKGIPRYPVPAMRIGKLAIDLQYQKQGVGAFLLKDVFSRALSLSKEIGLKCILVDAINDKAKSFYMKYGFIQFPEKPLILVLPIETVISAIS